MLRTLFTTGLLILNLLTPAHAGIALNIDDDTDIKRVAAILASDMMSEYKGNLSGGTPGLLPGPPDNPAITNAGYFWWEAGAMFGSLLDYWYYTGDESYNDVIYEAILHQVGDNKDFMPQNQTAGMGNDDQGFWGMTAMTAAEFGFRDPPADQPQWLALAQAVFNSQVGRYDNENCNGGLRWQAYSILNGYKYKNSISNGCLFNIASRLALYTGNQTYADWAEKIFSWMEGVKFIDDDWAIYDGAGVEQNCTLINELQFSYNAGIFLLGAGTMYNLTGSQVWKTRTDGVLNKTISTFFPNGIATEVSCEAQLTCTIDMFAQKAFLTRWMAATTKVAPHTYDIVMPQLRSSAKAAVQQCVGGETGRRCGLSWSKLDVWDGTQGVGQEMGVLEVVQSLLIKNAKVTFTNSTGGTSAGDPDAGSTQLDVYADSWVINGRDKAGAGVLTALFGLGFAGMCAFMTFGK